VRVPVNTFRLQARVVDTIGGGSPTRPERPSASQRSSDFRVNRYSDPLR
jgi:hypothetical protein